MKKTISIAAVICLLLTSLSLPAMAADTDNLATVLSNYVIGEAVYTNTFDTADNVTAFGKFRASNAGDTLASVEGALKVNHNYASTDENNVDFISSDLSEHTESKTNKVLIKFTLNMDEVWATATLRIGNSATGNGLVQLGITSSTDSGSLEVSYGDTTSQTRKTTSHSKLAGNNTYIVLLDYDDDTYSLWLNTPIESITSENALCKNYKFVTAHTDEDTYTSAKYFRLYAGKGTTSGSWTMDDFAIYPLEEPKALPAIDTTVGTNGYLYNEDFTVGTPGAVLGTDGESDPYGYVKEENIITGSGNTASNGQHMTITANGELQIETSTTDTTKPHCWYFGKTALASMKSHTGNLAVSMKIKADKKTVINFGVGINTSAVIHTTWTTSKLTYGTRTGDEQTTPEVTTTFVGTEEMAELLFLIDISTDTFSLWLNETRIVTAMPLYNSLTTYDGLKCINFRADAALDTAPQTITVDDIKVYAVKDDDFLKVENTIANIQEISDICTMGDDTLPTDLKSNSEIAGNLGCSVEITDSKGYVSDTGNIIFPLFAEDTTDITVKVTKGSITSVREFANVAIPKAYTFDDINWGTETPTAGSQFDGVIIPATVRNAASDNGRLFIAAALFDNADGSQVVEKIGVQTDTLAENGQTAEGFPIILDLTNLDELPASSLVKVFLWDEKMVPFGTVYEKAYTIE